MRGERHQLALKGYGEDSFLADKGMHLLLVVGWTPDHLNGDDRGADRKTDADVPDPKH